MSASEVERQFEVTGQEMYHIERAGYFIRRNLITPDMLTNRAAELFPLNSRSESVQNPTPLDRLLASLLGAPIHWTYASESVIGEAYRNVEAVYAPSDSHAMEHVAPRHTVWVRVALTDDAGVIAVPGSHDPSSYRATDTLPAANEEITLRLAAGDVAVLHPNLLLREICQQPQARTIMARASSAGVPGAGRVM